MKFKIHRRCGHSGGNVGRVSAATAQPRSTPATRSTPAMRVLVFSDDAHTREQVRLALGERPHPDLPPIDYVEVATAPVVIDKLDSGGIDLAILDGEASPAGGLGVARQAKDEVSHCPPILILTGRPDDAWLASWSRAEAAVSQPIDPIELASTVITLLRTRLNT